LTFASIDSQISASTDARGSDRDTAGAPRTIDGCRWMRSRCISASSGTPRTC